MQIKEDDQESKRLSTLSKIMSRYACPQIQKCYNDGKAKFRQFPDCLLTDSTVPLTAVFFYVLNAPRKNHMQRLYSTTDFAFKSIANLYLSFQIT